MPTGRCQSEQDIARPHDPARFGRAASVMMRPGPDTCKSAPLSRGAGSSTADARADTGRRLTECDRCKSAASQVGGVQKHLFVVIAQALSATVTGRP